MFIKKFSRARNWLPVLVSFAGFGSSLMVSESTFAWSRRGHAIVCETAAYLTEPAFLKKHSFDLGYYCNVPDLIWKKPEFYKVEWTNHFMNMENFIDAIKDSSELKRSYSLAREKFDSEYPQLKQTTGRAFWRIQELEQLLEKTSSLLKTAEFEKEARHKAQADWILQAGALGHYIGDLSQPFHVTQEYDGLKAGQKGIHAFFEEDLIDELYGKGLGSEVMKVAKNHWPAYHKKAAKKSVLDLVIELMETSNKKIDTILALDKKIGRTDLVKAAKAHRAIIVDCLVNGALTQAEIMNRHTDWNYDGSKFFNFYGQPEYINPGNMGPSKSE